MPQFVESDRGIPASSTAFLKPRLKSKSLSRSFRSLGKTNGEVDRFTTPDSNKWRVAEPLNLNFRVADPLVFKGPGLESTSFWNAGLDFALDFWAAPNLNPDPFQTPERVGHPEVQNHNPAVTY